MAARYALTARDLLATMPRETALRTFRRSLGRFLEAVPYDALLGYVLGVVTGLIGSQPVRPTVGSLTTAPTELPS